jgi:uncharacterized protein YutE (UPF0331/DUF86 family)
MDRDIVMRKLDSLAGCVERIEEKRPATLERLIGDIDLQDILSINLERAVQVSVDIGAHLIADLSVPPPKTMGDVFAILAAEKLMPEETATALRTEALANLKEAVELFLETASPAELEGRLSEESWITQFETEYAPA